MSQLKSLTSGLKFNAKNNAQAKALLLPSATELALQDDAPVLLEVDALRKKHKIKLTGSDIPDPIQSFSDVLTAENELVLDNLLSSAFLHPTPVQMQAIPLLLQHRDLLICSRTGSGKTLAFALPLLLRWIASKPSSLTSIVIEPTRELARQVYDQFKLLSKDTGCRVGILGEEGLEEEAHILITTPLRLVYAIKAKSIDVKK
jgi:ATP-dependent RNA helicase DDX52/ROK1